MARTNTAVKTPRPRTHGGGVSFTRQSARLELLRAASSCLLFEDTFYESGSAMATRMAELAMEVEPQFLADLAVDLRTNKNLRHVALWMAVQLCRKEHRPVRHGEGNVDRAAVVASVIQRADELAEIIALYWKQNPEIRKGKGRDRRAPLPSALKRGIATAFESTRFREYHLAKYNRPGLVALKDALFLSHPKVQNKEQERIWPLLMAGNLATPDTWEVSLSAGKDKGATFKRLIQDGKLGATALLRNLRNMVDSGVEEDIVVDALANASDRRILPYEYIKAAIAAPRFEPAIEQMMIRGVRGMEKLPGSTLFIVDTSGSMQRPLAVSPKRRADLAMDRIDAAAGLAIQMRAVCEDAHLYATAGNDSKRVHSTMELPARDGFALRDILKHAPHKIGSGGIFLVQCLKAINEYEKGRKFDRVVVFTDEQDCDTNPLNDPAKALRLGKFNYLVNVASYKPGIPVTKDWTRINGFSESLVPFIKWHEEIESEISQGGN